MESCNLVSAVIYLENMHKQLIEEKSTHSQKAAELINDLVQDIAAARSTIVNNSALAGANNVDIYNHLAKSFVPTKGVKGEAPKQQANPTYDNIAGFKLGEVQEVELSKLLDLVGEISAHATINRFGEGATDLTTNSVEVLTRLLKSSLGSSNKSIKVRLVNKVHEKVNGSRKETLGSYNSDSGVLTIALNPNKENKTLLKSTGLAVIKELMFAMTEQVLKDSPELDTKVTKLRKYAEKMYKDNNKRAPSYIVGSETYGLRSNKTFMSEVLTSGKLQKLLIGMEPSTQKNILTRVKTLFDEVVKKVKARLGLPLDSYTLFDESLEVVSAVLDNNLEPLVESEQAVVSTLLGTGDDSVGITEEQIIAALIAMGGKNGLIATKVRDILGDIRARATIIGMGSSTETMAIIMEEELKSVDPLVLDAFNDVMSQVIAQMPSSSLTESGKDSKSTNTDTSGGYQFKKDDQMFTTNESQTEAIDTMKKWYVDNDSTKPHFLLQGRGGTGKTTVINVLMEELVIGKDEVMFAAHMHKAYKVLKDANLATKYRDSKYTTLASILNLKPALNDTFEVDYFAQKKKLPKLLVIDEVSMVQSDHYKMLIEKAARDNTRIVFMGDHAQLPPVNDPDPSAQLKSLVFDSQKDSTTHLNELMRQDKDSPIVTATDKIIHAVNAVEKLFYKHAKGKASMSPLNVAKWEQEAGNILKHMNFDGEAFKHSYNETSGEGVISTKDDFDSILPHLINDLKNDLQGTKYIHFHNHKHKITTDNTKAIRKGLFPEMAEENPYISGEPMVLNSSYIPVAQNVENEDIILNNAEEFEIVNAERHKMHIPYTVTPGRGKKQHRETERKVDVYMIQAYSKARGTEFTFYKPVETDKYALSSMLNEIMEEENAVPSKFLKGNMKKLVLSAMGTYMASDLTHSYIINTHKAQGSSYNTVYLDVGNILGQKHSSSNDKAKSLYVGGSRPKKRLVIIDNRHRGSVTNGSSMDSVPLVDYVLKDLGTAPKVVVSKEVNKCQSKGP